jgi:hypothetical protein
VVVHAGRGPGGEQPAGAAHQHGLGTAPSDRLDVEAVDHGVDAGHRLVDTDAGDHVPAVADGPGGAGRAAAPADSGVLIG